MTAQLIAYTAYLTITAFIILWVGNAFYRYGSVYLDEAFEGDSQRSKVLNKLLLTGYYLINLGYATWSLSNLGQADSLSLGFGVLSSRIGFITLALGLIHFINLWWVRQLPNWLKH